jgi:hypothetical protein
VIANTLTLILCYPDDDDDAHSQMQLVRLNLTLSGRNTEWQEGDDVEGIPLIEEGKFMGET